MAFVSGSRIGSYEITGEIGAGGMGVVYRARDTRLKRDVAIKVLPTSLATDVERLARFQREAEMLASLNHPNIAQIYGLEESDGTTTLVLELVDGPTLAERIAQGALPIDEALGVALQIADALEAAHGKSIVHRDLKPANIKLRPDGVIKVLDFGIAKALDTRATSDLSPVMATPTMTQAGIILGTAAYMSPEQARGKGVDERTDIWALGCLLFEMLTGQPAFGGEDVTVTLARILERDPDMTALPVSVSAAVRHTIGMCLRKDVRKRLADTRDFKLSVDGEFVPETAEGGGGRGDGWRSALPFIFGSSLLTGALVAGLAWMRQPEVEPSLPTRFVYDLPDGQEIQGQQGPVLAISSDGRQFVYSTDGGLYVRAMDNLEAKLIPGSESIFDVHTFSPDGRSVAGWGYPGRLTRIATIGGAVVPIADLSAGRDLPGIELYGVDWQIDGTILYTQRDGIYRIAAGGGVPEPLISFEDVTVYGAESLPDGDSVLFSVTETGNWDTAQIVVQSVSTGERTELGLSGSDARYLPTSRSTGHIVYALGTQLFAARFDPQTLRTSSAAVPVLQEVLRAEGGPSGVAHYDVSDNGTLIYISGDVRPKFLRTLVWVDRQGNEQPIDVPPRSYRSPRISPDGAKIALTVRENLPEGDVWTWDIARRTLVPVTAGPGLSRFPAWSRDGEHIAYVWRSILGGAASRLYRLPADGSGNADLLAETPYQLSPPTFLPDDTGLVLSGNVEPGNEDIAIVALAGSGAVEVRPLLTTPLFDEQHPEVSPDGRWLAYTSNESGTDEVWVRPYPNLEGERHLVSAGGGEQPLWSPDGSELFYRSGDAVMVVDVETDPSFRTGDPEALFGGYPIVTQGGRDYDTRDGERFIMMKQVQETSAGTEIIVVENWFGELKRLAPPTP